MSRIYRLQDHDIVGEEPECDNGYPLLYVRNVVVALDPPPPHPRERERGFVAYRNTPTTDPTLNRVLGSPPAGGANHVEISSHFRPHESHGVDPLISQREADGVNPSLVNDGDDEDGYGSDTGARDIPKCSNFITETPIVKSSGISISGVRGLNRQGRAIARIVHEHGWSLSKIAKIMRMSTKPVRRAVKNNYKHRTDDVSEDYAYANKVDPEYGVYYPPRSAHRSTVPDKKERVSHSSEIEKDETNISHIAQTEFDAGSTTDRRFAWEDNRRAEFVAESFVRDSVHGYPRIESDSINNQPSEGIARESQTVSPTIAASAFAQTHQLPRLSTVRKRQTPGSLMEFLQNAMGVNLGHLLPKFQNGGLDLVVLKAMDHWTDEQIEEQLKAVLSTDATSSRLCILRLAIRNLV